MTLWRLRWLLLPLLMLAARAWGAEDNFDFFSDQPIAETALVHVEPPKPEWMTIGGPVALLVFFFRCVFWCAG